MALPRRSILRRAALLAAGALVFVVGGALAWHLLAPRETPAGQQPLTHLSPESLAALRDAFNAAGDQIRVVALLSPT